MTDLPEATDSATQAVRAGVRLGQGSPQALLPRDASNWERIKSFGRRQLQHVRLAYSSFLRRSGDPVPFADDAGPTDLLPRAPAVRLAEHEVLVHTPYGWLIVPAEDEVLLAAMMHGGVLEPGTVSVITRLLREGDTVVDVGANIGLVTMPAARRVGADGSVIAFEPLPRLVDVLRRSIHINGVADRVRVEACACADKPGTARLHIGKVLGHSSLLPLDGETGVVDVALCRLDDMVPSGQPVALVKIDAEGYETHVWRGMQRVVSENPDLALIVEFAPSHLERAGLAVNEWLDEFSAKEFRPYEIDENTGCCAPLRTEGLDEMFSVNLLFLRRPASHYPDIEFV